MTRLAFHPRPVNQFPLRLRVDTDIPLGRGDSTWSTSGAGDRIDVNQTYLQPSANYNLGSALSAGVSVEASANWNADDTWMVSN